MSENEKIEKPATTDEVDDRAQQSLPRLIRNKPRTIKGPSPASSSVSDAGSKEMKSELKKVVWPSGKQTVNNTVIVIICVIVVGACIWIFDWLAGEIVRALLALFGKV